MSDEVHLGSIVALSDNTDPAFRVEFDGKPPAPRDRYWRVYVLSDNDESGGWRRRTMMAFDGGEPGDFEGTGPPIRYTVTVEPHNQHWLPALDLPVEAPDAGKPRHGFLVASERAVTRATRYSMTSRQVARTAPLNILESRANLQMATQPSPRTAALLAQWRNLAPRAKVQAALDYFHDQPFRYTLAPPALQGDRIDKFLFDTRAGYCEHYASAFVSLMRWSGVPARLLAGYQGGEWNSSGGYFTVYQSDAHAWAEVWLPDHGWTRVDPTAAVAPERIEMGAEAIRLLRTRGFSGPAQRGRGQAADRPVMAGPAVAAYPVDLGQRQLCLRYLGHGLRAGDAAPVHALAGLSHAELDPDGRGPGGRCRAPAARRRDRHHPAAVREDPVLRLYRRALRKLGRAGMDNLRPRGRGISSGGWSARRRSTRGD